MVCGAIVVVCTTGARGRLLIHRRPSACCMPGLLLFYIYMMLCSSVWLFGVRGWLQQRGQGAAWHGWIVLVLWLLSQYELQLPKCGQ